MQKKYFILIITLSLFISCTSSKKSTFLYKGDFFQRGISPVNNPYQLTVDISSEFYPVVSHDGKYIIYVSDKTGNLDLWLYDILSRNSFQITYHTSDDTMPAFSKNGKEILFISFRQDGQGDIYKMDFDDIIQRSQAGLSDEFKKELLKDDGASAITKNRIQETEPVYIDNKYLFFVRPDNKGIKNIFKTKDKLNADISQITKNGALSPDISPDEQFMVYIDISKNKKHNSHIFLFNLASGKVKQITHGNSIEAKPRYINDYQVIYSSIRFDSNKNNKIDLNDNSSIYVYNLKTGQEKQCSPDNYTDYYPVYSKIYNGVIFYTSNQLDNIDLWMLPIEGIIPELQDPKKQLKLIDSIDDNYLKLIGYKNLLKKKSNKNQIRLKIANIYKKLNYPKKQMTYLSNVITHSAPEDKEYIEAKIKLIENIYSEKQDAIHQIKLYKNTIKTNRKLFQEIHLINFRLSQIYKENKKYGKAISHLEKIVSSYTNKDDFLFKSVNNLMELYLRFNRFSKAQKHISLINNYKDIEKIINFQNKFISLAIKFSPDLNKEKIYKNMLNKYIKEKKIYYNILYHYADYLQGKKKARKIFRRIVKESSLSYLKIKALNQLYQLTKKEKYINDILQLKIEHPEISEISEISEIIEQLKTILINKYLKQAKKHFNNNDMLASRLDFQKALKIDKKNIGALVGKLRCDFKLLKPEEDRYNSLIKQYDTYIKKNSSNYVYYYLKGYGYSLIYSTYYLQYKLSLKRGEPFLFTKVVDLFRSNKPYPSTFRKKLGKYFKLSEENLKITYRLKPNFIPAYLTSGWLNQVQAEINKDKYITYIENTIPLYQSAIHFNNETKEPDMEAKLCLNLANLYFNLRNYTQALQFYNKKIKYSTEFDSKIQEAFFYYHLGYSGWFLGKDTIAIENFKKAYETFLSLKEHHGAYRSLIFLAMVNRINNNHKESLKYYSDAVNLINKFKIKQDRERIIREIGICYKNLKDLKTALQFFKKAEKIIPEDKKSLWKYPVCKVGKDKRKVLIWQKLPFWQQPAIRAGIMNFTVPVMTQNITLGQSFAYHGFKNTDEQKLLYSLIGETYENFMDYKKAIKYLLLKKKLFEKDNNFNAIPYVYNNLGYLYFRLNDFNKAAKYYAHSNRLLRKNTKKDKQGNKVPKDIKGIIINNLNLVEILLELNKEKNISQYFNELVALLDKTIKLAEGKKYESFLIKTYNLYGLLYFKKAIKNQPASIKMGNIYKSIKANYKDFFSSLKYYKSAYEIASRKKLKKDLLYIDFNMGLIYYHTKDFSKSLKIFQQLNLQAKKYFILDLKWKTDYYILHISHLTQSKSPDQTSYENIINQIEEAPKGYNYIPEEDPIIETIYNEYIQYLINKKNYLQALELIEKKKNFKIKERFLSYPFNLQKKDNNILKKLRDLEEENLALTCKAGKDLIKKFNIKKHIQYETEIKKNCNKIKHYTDSLKHSKPQLLYYIHKNIPEFNKKIKNLSNKNVILLFNTYKTNLNIGVITNSVITFQKIKINPEHFNENINKLWEKLQDDEEYSFLTQYFTNTFIQEIKKIIQDKEIITILPDEQLFSFPFHVFLTNKKIHYDISLAQFFLNIEKIPLVNNIITILNTDSRLNKIAFKKNQIQDNILSEQTIKNIASGSYNLHIPDGIQFDHYTPINYKIVYNENYMISIDNIMQYKFNGELISFEKLADNFEYNEKNIYSLLIPLYYAGAPAVSFNLWNVKEKIQYNFWINYYRLNNLKLIDKYTKSQGNLSLDYNNFHESYFKMFYGNFGIDKEYKINVLLKKGYNSLQIAKNQTNTRLKITYYEKIFQIEEELKSFKTNLSFNTKKAEADLIQLYVKNNAHEKALTKLEKIISIETNEKEKEEFQHYYETILSNSHLTNKDVKKLNRFIETGDKFYVLKKYEPAIESYKNAYTYLKNSTLTISKTPIMYKLCESFINNNDLDEAEKWIQMGLSIVTNQNIQKEKDKFLTLYARYYFTEENYNKTLDTLKEVNKKSDDYFILKINALLKSELIETTKYTQINQLINKNIHKFSKKYLKEIFNPIIHYYEDNNYSYQFINHFKNKIHHSRINLKTIQQKLKTNSILIDFYVSDKKIYSTLITKNEIKTSHVKTEKFHSLFSEYQMSIRKNDEEDFKDAQDDLFELLFEDMQKDISKSSNIILYPDDSLFFINFTSDNNIFSINNQNIKVIRSYNSLIDSAKKALSFQGYGLMKNLPGKIVMDFSFKEINSLKHYFKKSIIKINPSKIKINKNINSFHLSLPVLLNKTNINIIDEMNNKHYNLLNLLKNKHLFLLLLTKMNYQDLNSSLLFKINTRYLILSLWRNNDALSAIFIRNFYYYLTRSSSVEKAYRRTVLKMKQNYENELQWNSFILIQ